jgi:hypothetical protein
MALGLLLNLYRDRQICITVGEVGGFSSFDPRSLLLFCQCRIVGSWVHQLAFLEVEALDASMLSHLENSNFKRI